MRQSLRCRAAASAVAVIVVSFGAFAAPALAGHGKGGHGRGGMAGGCGCRGTTLVSLDAAASALGITSAQLTADVKSGKSLAQIAAAAGTSISTVAQTVQGDAKASLDAAVAAGSLSTGQAQAVLLGVPQQVATLVTGTVRGLLGGCGLLRLDVSTAARLLGVTSAQLKAQLAAGQTLAQIAAAAGKSLSSVAQAASAAVKSSTDAAVAAGSLSQGQADSIVSGATQQIAGVLGG